MLVISILLSVASILARKVLSVDALRLLFKVMSLHIAVAGHHNNVSSSCLFKSHNLLDDSQQTCYQTTEHLLVLVLFKASEISLLYATLNRPFLLREVSYYHVSSFNPIPSILLIFSSHLIKTAKSIKLCHHRRLLHIWLYLVK